MWGDLRSGQDTQSVSYLGRFQPAALLIAEADILTPNVHIDPKLGDYIGAAHCDSWRGEGRP